MTVDEMTSLLAKRAARTFGIEMPHANEGAASGIAGSIDSLELVELILDLEEDLEVELFSAEQSEPPAGSDPLVAIATAILTQASPEAIKRFVGNEEGE